MQDTDLPNIAIVIFPWTQMRLVAAPLDNSGNIFDWPVINEYDIHIPDDAASSSTSWPEEKAALALLRSMGHEFKEEIASDPGGDWVAFSFKNADDKRSGETYTRRDDAIEHEIVAAIEAGATGDAYAEFDVEAIADEVLGGYDQGFACLVQPERFWEVVEKHAIVNDSAEK